MDNIQRAKKAILCILLLLSIVPIGAQEYSVRTCISNKLQDIAMKLYADYQIDCTAATVGQVNGWAITIKKNEFGKISHIGFNLFPDKIMDSSTALVYQFIERYLLDLYLLEEDSLIRQQMDEDKVGFWLADRMGKDAIRSQLMILLPLFQQLQSFVMTEENNMYVLSCMREEKPIFGIRFPIDYQLLTGMNKKECEQSLYLSLLAYTEKDDEMPEADTRLLEQIGRNCYMQKGDIYQIEAMNANRYYALSDGAYVQLADTAYVEESIKNLFTMYADRRVEAEVTLRMYGQKKMDFTVSLHKLLDFCKTNGCRIFAGIESVDAPTVKGTAILLNQAHGYNHTLAFAVDSRILENISNYKVKVDMYMFIPVHNIETLFYENLRNK